MRTAGVGADDVVVEVGPGLGSLTLGLLEAARRVVAVEIDPVLAARAAGDRRRAGCPTPTLEVVRRTPSTLTGVPGPAPTAFVANLPYNVAVPVLLHLLEQLPSLRSGLVMVQAEVADRLAAPPGQQDLRRPVGQGRLVRGRPPGRLDRPQRLLAGAERRLRAGRASPGASRRRGDRRADLRRRRRRVRPAPQDAAGSAGRLGGRRAAGRAAAARGRRRPRRARRDARRRRTSSGSRAASVPAAPH